jgi:hypothetical protein
MIDFQKFREFSSCKFESEHTKQNEITAMVRPDLVTDNQFISQKAGIHENLSIMDTCS